MICISESNYDTLRELRNLETFDAALSKVLGIAVPIMVNNNEKKLSQTAREVARPRESARLEPKTTSWSDSGHV